MNEKIEQKIIEIAASNLKIDAGKISVDSKFVEDLGADSLDVVELIMAFEGEFGCNIPDDAAKDIVTIKDAVAYISNLKEKEQGIQN